MNSVELHDLQVNGLKIYQYNVGFRFGTDAVALANFASAKRKDIALDIGSGSGIIPIMLAGKFGVGKVYGVEIQEKMANLSIKSIEYNGLSDKVQIINAKIQEIDKFLPIGCCTLVTANPPYSKVGSGEHSIDDSVAISRFEQAMPLVDTIKAARYLLSTGGRFCIVHKTDRLAEVISECMNVNLQPKILKFINNKLFLLNCVVDGAIGLILMQ